MKENIRAYFVKRPRVYEDLTRPDTPRIVKDCRIARAVFLDAVDYENFTTDMSADRRFIGDCAAFCRKEDVWSCLLVRRRGARTGILIMPERGCHVGYAACWPDAAEHE